MSVAVHSVSGFASFFHSQIHLERNVRGSAFTRLSYPGFQAYLFLQHMKSSKQIHQELEDRKESRSAAKR